MGTSNCQRTRWRRAVALSSRAACLLTPRLGRRSCAPASPGRYGARWRDGLGVGAADHGGIGYTSVAYTQDSRRRTMAIGRITRLPEGVGAAQYDAVSAKLGIAEDP